MEYGRITDYGRFLRMKNYKILHFYVNSISIVANWIIRQYKHSIHVRMVQLLEALTTDPKVRVPDITKLSPRVGRVASSL